MMDKNTANSQSLIDQSVTIPDYFSCRNCIAWDKAQIRKPGHRTAGSNGWATTCEVLRDEHTCAKQMLAEAIKSGQVQIQLLIGVTK
jgi:hypothetical protein